MGTYMFFITKHIGRIDLSIICVHDMLKADSRYWCPNVLKEMNVFFFLFLFLLEGGQKYSLYEAISNV